MARDAAPYTPGPTGLERLPASHWTHARCAPGGPAHPADEVLVGPSGVYVIVRRTGGLEVDVDAARTAATAVTGMLPDRYRERVVPVLCLLDDDPVAQWQDGVLVTGTSTMPHVVRSSPVRLSTSEVRGLGPALAARLDRGPDNAVAPRRRRPSLALLAGVAASATVILSPWFDDVWLALQQGIGLLR